LAREGEGRACDVLDCSATAELVKQEGAEVLPLRVDVTNGTTRKTCPVAVDDSGASTAWSTTPG
jgi:hypothetical protein